MLVGLLLLAGCGQPKEQRHHDPISRMQNRILDHPYFKGDWLDEALAQATEKIRLNPNDAYAGVAKDHDELDPVALMNEYCYRPIRDKRNELQ